MEEWKRHLFTHCNNYRLKLHTNSCKTVWMSFRHVWVVIVCVTLSCPLGIYIFPFRVVGQECRWMGTLGHGSQITVDLHTKCIKLADLSQDIWLIHSYSSTSEQGVVGRDQWHNGLCQIALQNAQTICGDNPDAIRAIIAPIHPRNKHSFSTGQGKIGFLLVGLVQVC